MKKILEAIWKFINSKFFGYALVIIAIIIIASQCQRNRNLKQDNIINEQNLAAKDKEINSYKNKNDELVAEKAIYILTEKELKKENKELSDKVKAQSGHIISLNNVVFGLKQDTTILHDSIRYLKAIIGNAIQLDATSWVMPWTLEYKWDKDNYDIFKGRTFVDLDTNTFKLTHKNTLLDYRDSQIDLTFGEKVVDGKYNVYITTKYPGLSAKSMSGVLIDPNFSPIKNLVHKRHWFSGFSVSVGLTPGWDFINNKFTVVVGPSIGYSIYQW
jgi:cell division protein FtsB